MFHQFFHRAAGTEFDSFVFLVDPNRMARGPVVNLTGINRFFGSVRIVYGNRTFEHCPPVRALKADFTRLQADQQDCSILVGMTYHIGDFELDIAWVELRKAGSPCPLEPQIFALLTFLVEHCERVVSKDEIFEKVWDGRFVTDSALTSRVKLARRVLGDDGKAQTFIRTVHGQGFRFVAEVRVQADISLISPLHELPPDGILKADVPAATGARPSIAILPFQRIGETGVFDNIVEGLPHELITELACLRWLSVIARGSSFRLSGQNLDARVVGRRLGVRYILSGTVEVTGQQLVITAELVDTLGGDVVWGERYSGYVDEVHAVRDEIRLKILTSLEIQIPLHEATRARLLVTLT